MKLVFFILSILLVLTACTQEHKVSATLSIEIHNDSTLLINVALCNNTSDKLYLTCGNPCIVGFQGDFQMSQHPMSLDSSIIALCNASFDTIKMSYPNIKEEERYQVNCYGDTADIYYLVSRLLMTYAYKYMATHPVPSPPDDADSLCFCDYNFLKLCRENYTDWTDIVESGISNQIVLLEPFEKRVFSSNEAFLLPLKTIYKLQLSLEPNDNMRCQFLDSLGYQRYDETITSESLLIDNK